MFKSIRRLLTALERAWLVFISHYDASLADEEHLNYRKRDPQFQQFQQEVAKALAAEGHISSDWLNTYIPTVVPQEAVWECIDGVKTKAIGVENA